MPEFELPREYVPQSLRAAKEDHRPEKTTYAIGYTSDAKHFGMAHGPTESLQEMLDTIPEHHADKVAVLLAYPGRNDDWNVGILYVWSVDGAKTESGIWIRNNKFNPNIRFWS